jgi:quercetin dioxygenase-like cupin family protein
MSVAAETVQQAIKRTTLQKFDVPGANYETVIELTEFAPNAVLGRHTHPGTEASYVLEGDVMLELDGRPAQNFKAGQSYQVPPNLVHTARAGTAGWKAVLVWVVDKDKTFRAQAK